MFGSSMIALLGGASKRYSQLEDEKRQNEQANRTHLADLLGKELTANWDIMGPEQRQAGLGQLGQLLNIKPEHMETLQAIGGHVYNVMQDRGKTIRPAPQPVAPSMQGATPVPQAALAPMPPLPTTATVPEAVPYQTAAEARQAMGMNLAKQKMAMIEGLNISPDVKSMAQANALGVGQGMGTVMGAGIRANSAERMNLLRLQQMGLKGSTEWVDAPDGTQHLLFKNSVGGAVYDLTASQMLSQGISGTPAPTNVPQQLSDIPQPPTGLSGMTRTATPTAPQVVQDAQGNYVQLDRQRMKGKMKKDNAIAGVYPVQGPPKTSGTGTFTPIKDKMGNITSWVNTKTLAEGNGPVGGRTTGMASTELTQQSNLKDMAVSLSDLEFLSAQPAVKEYIGPVRGRIAGMARGLISYPAEVNELFRLSDNMADILLRARSGAQINEREFARLRSLIPNPRENADKFFTDLKSFKRELGVVLSVRGLDDKGEPLQGGAAPISRTPSSMQGTTTDSDKFHSKSKRGRYNPSTGQVEY